MGTHPIFESDFDCLTEMAETDKPSVLEARLQAARERRQRQEKERADRKTEMASKLEETEKRRQDLVSARDAKIEAKKGTESENDDDNNEQNELLLENLAEKMTKKGGLKYAFDRQGKLVLIQQTKGIQRQDVQFFGFMALVVIYLLFFYEPAHLRHVRFIKEYASSYHRRFFRAIDRFYDPSAKYDEL